MTGKKIERRDFLKGAVGVAGAGVVAGLAGCQPAQPTAAPTAVVKAADTVAPTAAAAGATTQPVPTVATLKYADKVCVHRYLTGGFSGPGPDDKLVAEIQHEALRREYGLNVEISPESAPWADFDNLLNIRLETMETDSIERSPDRILRAIAEEGQIMYIDEIMETYGQNLIAKFPRSGFEFFSRGDGRYVGLANGRGRPMDTEYMNIRRDWCDKVDRDVPTTIEELIEVLRLFKQKNLGGDVTIPLTPESPQWLASSLFKGQFVPEPEEQFKMMENGEDNSVAGQYTIAERLAVIQEMYADGLINPEYLNWTTADMNAAVDKGIVGCVMGQPQSETFYWRVEHPELGIDPTQDWVLIYPPLARKGVPNSGRVSAYSSQDRGLVVCTWANCPEAIIALMDFQNKSWENYTLCKWGIEGKHWEWGENGCRIDLRSPSPNQEYTGMHSGPTAPEWATKAALLPPRPDRLPKDETITPRLNKNHFRRADTTKPEPGEYAQCVPIHVWCPLLLPKSASTQAERLTMRTEMIDKVIKGELDVDAALKDFWPRWMAAGGEVEIQEINDQFFKWWNNNPAMQDFYIYSSHDHWDKEIKYPERPQRG